MEFMKITDSSIKISLGAKEAAEYNITEGTVADTKEIKQAFSKLLDKAKRELGIKLPQGQLLAEVFSSRDGGFEIFVSYLNGEKEAGATSGAVCAPNSVAAAQRSAFLVSSPDLLIYLKKHLDKTAHEYEIYFHENTKKYYLILRNFKKSDIALSYLGELATPVRQSIIRYIQSYATKIAP